MRKFSRIFLSAGLLLFAGCSAIQRKLLFYPSHHGRDNGLAAWKLDGKIIGFCRQVPDPANVWLLLHGNAGQAADRAYAISSYSQRDSVFIMEYPGYGPREGEPSKASFDAAAVEAYLLLKKTFAATPVCVAGESIGTGPACALAGQSQPPAKIVLLVPFDTLKAVAHDHFPHLPVGLILGASWDNIEALKNYPGPVEIFGAAQDNVIKIEHAKALADSFPAAKFHRIEGGHNDWSTAGRVEIRNP